MGDLQRFSQGNLLLKLSARALSASGSPSVNRSILNVLFVCSLQARIDKLYSMLLLQSAVTASKIKVA